MERPRHRFRILKYSYTTTEEGSETEERTLRNYISSRSRPTTTRWNNSAFNLIVVVVTVICVCLPNIQVVLSAEVGVGENNSVKNHREILHRAGENNKSMVEKVNVGESENVNFESQKLQHLVSLTDKQGCGDKGCGNESHEASHKLQSILRDIFLDELGEETFEDEFESTNDASENEDSQVLTKLESYQIPISRHSRSPEPNTESPLFPEGRGQRGGKAKGTRGSPRENQNQNGDKKGGNRNAARNKNKKKSGTAGKGSDLTKYNEYMDAVFKRMNAMIKKKRMDPLRVNLFAGPNKTNQGQKKQNGGKGKNKKKHSARMDLNLEDEDEEDLEQEEDVDGGEGPARKDIYLDFGRAHGHGHPEEDEEELDERVEDEKDSVRRIRALLENLGNSTVPLTDPEENPEGPRGNASKPKKPKGSSTSGNKDKGQKNSGNKKNKATENGSSDGKNKNKNKNKNNKNNKKPTRGILHGLSTLKREGNVAVIRQGDKVRVVRANFILGPVALEILPKKSKLEDSPDKKEVAATATAPKLKGILEVRLKKGSPTSIRKLRVFPPKSVKVDGTSVTSGGGKKKPQQYGKVTPMATARLRQIATTVVRETDKKFKKPLLT